MAASGRSGTSQEIFAFTFAKTGRINHARGSNDQSFLDACRRRPTDVRPVWFMRQAGRYMNNTGRSAKARHPGDLQTAGPASTVTLQPVEILDVDAAIIFADLLLPIEPMGLKLRYEKGSGPAIDNPVRTSDDVDSLSTAYTDDLGYVGEAIQATVRALAGRVPVIGFVALPSPWPVI